MLFRRGRIWWFEFKFAGRRIRESSRSRSKTVARAAELKRRRHLEEHYNGVIRRQLPMIFTVAADRWLESKRPSLAPKSLAIEQVNLRKHLVPAFGSLLLADITAEGIATYQKARLGEGARPQTINLEIGTLRAILRRHRLWALIQPDVRMLTVRSDVGRALSLAEERRLLDACAASRSRVLLPVVTLGLATGLRYGELVSLMWDHVDLVRRTLRVGSASKTEAGRGRVVPLNDRATSCLTEWARSFPTRQRLHFVFPVERYGLGGNDVTPVAWGTDPTRHVQRLKVSWAAAKRAANVTVRFHDLRHTFATRLVEAGVSLPVPAFSDGPPPQRS
jgi:integrase